MPGVNDTGSRWEGRGRTQVMTDSRFKSGNVKGRMYLPHSSRESEPNRRRAPHPQDGERPHELWGQLSSSPSYGDVLCGEPHALSNPVDGGWNPSFVCLLFHPGRCFDEVSA